MWRFICILFLMFGGRGAYADDIAWHSSNAPVYSAVVSNYSDGIAELRIDYSAIAGTYTTMRFVSADGEVRPYKYVGAGLVMKNYITVVDSGKEYDIPIKYSGSECSESNGFYFCWGARHGYKNTNSVTEGQQIYLGATTKGTVNFIVDFKSLGFKFASGSYPVKLGLTTGELMYTEDIAPTSYVGSVVEKSVGSIIDTVASSDVMIEEFPICTITPATIEINHGELNAHNIIGASNVSDTINIQCDLAADVSFSLLKNKIEFGNGVYSNLTFSNQGHGWEDSLIINNIASYSTKIRSVLGAEDFTKIKKGVFDGSTVMMFSYQ